MNVFWLCLLLIAPQVRAETLQVSLATSGVIESTTGTPAGVVNLALGRFHAPLIVSQYHDSVLGFNDATLNVGDGSDGAFDSLANYLRFHDGTYLNDGTIVIDTDAHPNLQFTRFVLLSGFNLVGKGSQPLVIRSQSIITLASGSSISCNGGNGQNLNADPSTSAAGGVGRCGGKDGGRGESSALTVQPGFSQAANATGGGQTGAAEGDGGGGGGGFSQPVANPQYHGVATSGAIGGTRGTSLQDDAFTNTQGGAGGGGGRQYTLGAVNVNSSGAGGGAGGGSILMFGVGNMTVAATAQISANGGNGGGAAGGARLGGAGGGGAGGSIQIFVGGAFTLDGSVSATGGSGGVSATGDTATAIAGDSGRTGGDGGNGAAGRTWLVDQNCNAMTGCIGGSGTIDPGALLLDSGATRYVIGSFTASSSLLDTGNSLPRLSAVAMNSTVSGGSTASFEVAGGGDAFSVAGANWFSSASFSSISGRRYLRFRINLNNQDATTSAYASSVQFTYDPYKQTQFDFKPGCGLVESSGPTPGSSFLWIFLIPLLSYGVLRWRGRMRPSKMIKTSL